MMLRQIFTEQTEWQFDEGLQSIAKLMDEGWEIEAVTATADGRAMYVLSNSE